MAKIIVISLKSYVRAINIKTFWYSLLCHIPLKFSDETKKTSLLLTVCYYHVTYAFQSESTLGNYWICWVTTEFLEFCWSRSIFVVFPVTPALSFFEQDIYFFVTTFSSLLICCLIYSGIVFFRLFLQWSVCIRNVECFRTTSNTFFCTRFPWSFTFVTIILCFIFCFVLLRLFSSLFFMDIWILLL